MAPLFRSWVSSPRAPIADFGRSLASIRAARGLMGAPKAGSWLAGSPQDAGETGLSATLNQNAQVPVYISVHDIDGKHYPGAATVILRQGNAVIPVPRQLGQVLYRGDVAPGEYSIEVTAGGLVSPKPRPVVIPDDGKIASTYLGQPHWPFYRLGENAVPFAPRDDLIGVVFETGNFEDLERTLMIANDVAAQFHLTLYVQLDPDADLPFTAANGAIWVFQHTTTDPKARLAVVQNLRNAMAQRQPPARVGIPVDLLPGQVKVLDNRFVVRFKPSVTDIDNRVAQAGAGARIIRDHFIQGREIRLVEFQTGDFRTHLNAIENLFCQGVLLYGEPDLLAELIDTNFPQTEALDAMYPSQENLTLQRVDEAWQFLWSLDDDHHRTLGSPDVYVATVDEGVEMGHPDVNPTLTDCTRQIVVYQDFEGMTNCLANGVKCDPTDTHGVAVYGIIAARTNNLEPSTGNIAGIAPNTHQIVIKLLNVDCATYKDILEWTAGLQPLNPEIYPEIPQPTFPADWPHEPPERGADIINCSHAARYEALSGLMNDTQTQLITEGRKGLGTVLVYSAGNDMACITGTATWAAQPFTLAIANSTKPEGVDDVEGHVSNSNYGIEIDLCARGASVVSLVLGGAEDYFDGTSASAPTVAAAAALMLSVNPNLTWSEVRQILCDTAVQIDPANKDAIGGWSDDPDPFSQWYGYGRLDVCEAVRAAAARLPEPAEVAPAACPPEF